MFSPATSPSGYSPPLNSPAIGREQPSDPEKVIMGKKTSTPPLSGENNLQEGGVFQKPLFGHIPENFFPTSNFCKAPASPPSGRRSAQWAGW